MVGQGAIDAVIDAPGVKIGFELRIDSLRVALVKPYRQLFHLLRTKRVYRVFNFLYYVWIHRPLVYFSAEITAVFGAWGIKLAFYRLLIPLSTVAIPTLSSTRFSAQQSPCGIGLPCGHASG